MPSIHYQKIVDLTHPICPRIPLWPGDPNCEFETVAEIEQDGYYLRRFAIGEHSGTHINSPRSFYADGVSIDEYSPDSLVLPAVVINVCEKAQQNHDYCLTLKDIEVWEKELGEIPPKALIILYTGWQKRWHNSQAFFNENDQGKMHFPSFGLEAVKFLLEERNIVGIGIDTHGVDPSLDESFAVNRLMLSHPRIVLENLNNLHQLPSTGTTVVIGILRLQDGSGSPVSVLAFVS